MASTATSHTQRQQNGNEKPFAFGYMLLPEGNPEDAAAKEREFQQEIASLNDLFASDPYGGMNPFASPPLPTSMSTHEFNFTPPTVYGIDVYTEPTSTNGSHMSSMTAPYMGMHNPGFVNEFQGFNPDVPYTPTGEVTHSFAGLNMAAGAHRALSISHGTNMMNGLSNHGEANTASAPPTLQSPPPAPQAHLQRQPKYDDSTTKNVEPSAENFFIPYPEPKRRVPSNASNVSQLRFPHFGSDPAFRDQFQRSSDAPTHADIRSDIEAKTTFAFKPERNGDNSPPMSPYTVRRPSVAQLNRGESADSEQSANHDHRKASTKRRRIGSSQEISPTSDDDRPSELEGQDEEDGVVPPRNRRKSSSVANPRRNLTEEQRRQNHNKSEQRRRTVITDDLTLVRNLVPALINTTASKAIAIRETFQFLNELLENNKELEHILGPQIAGAGPFPSADYMRPDAPSALGP